MNMTKQDQREVVDLVLKDLRERPEEFKLLQGFDGPILSGNHLVIRLKHAPNAPVICSHENPGRIWDRQGLEKLVEEMPGSRLDTHITSWWQARRLRKGAWAAVSAKTKQRLIEGTRAVVTAHEGRNHYRGIVELILPRIKEDLAAGRVEAYKYEWVIKHHEEWRCGE